ncbi:MAG: GntR family transcriptional regulator [Burkholderiaceae bacterium]
MEKFQRPKSLTELAAEEIRNMIIEGKLELGAALSEGKLAKRFDVSRTPIREAFNRLETEGLVVTKPQSGTFVFKMHPAELTKICFVRIALELAAIDAAFEFDPVALCEKLDAITAEMTVAHQAGRTDLYLKLDMAFHQAIFDGSNNRFLNDAYQTIAYKMAALRNRLGRNPEHMKKSFDEHQQIVEAIRAGSLTQARTILAAHIDRKEGNYWSVTDVE